MLNIKETLKKLHNKFPLMSLDELFEILDCYVEDYYHVPNIPWDKEPPTVAKTSPYITTIGTTTGINEDINRIDVIATAATNERFYN